VEDGTYSSWTPAMEMQYHNVLYQVSHSFGMMGLEIKLMEMVDKNPAAMDTQAQLEVVRAEIKQMNAESKAYRKSAIVTRQEYTNATTAVRKMLDACQRVEADRLQEEALCRGMAAIRIDV
jgi:hypothetical protein